MRNWKPLVDKALAEASRAQRRLEEASQRLEAAKTRSEDTESARRLLQAVATATQQQAHGRIASVVSRCLESVFDDPYSFQIDFTKKRGRTEAEMLFGRDGIRVDPMSASGGGVVDIGAFAARVAKLVLSRPPRRRLLVLDEPFRFVSRDLRRRVRRLLESLAEEMEIQFIMVTHDPVLAVGKVVELS